MRRLQMRSIHTAISKFHAMLATPPKAGRRCGRNSNSNTKPLDLCWKGNTRRWIARNATPRSSLPGLPTHARPATTMCMMARSARTANVVTPCRGGWTCQKSRRFIRPPAFHCWAGISMSDVTTATPGKAPHNSSTCHCSAAFAIRRIIRQQPTPITSSLVSRHVANNAIAVRLPAGRFPVREISAALITAERVFPWWAPIKRSIAGNVT